MIPTAGEAGTANGGGGATRAGWAKWLNLSNWRSQARELTLSIGLGVLGGIVLAWLLGLIGGHRRRRIAGALLRPPARTDVPRSPTTRDSDRRVPRLAQRLATIGLVMLVTLLLPASVLAQVGQVVEYYHLDALGSVRVVSNQQGQIVSRHEFLPFGDPPSPIGRLRL